MSTTMASSRVLVIYTGGTIGMKRSDRGYVPEANYMEALLRSMSQFHDVDFEKSCQDESLTGFLTTPVSKYDRRVHYKILEYNPLLDSCNLSMQDWARIASDLHENYSHYDSFVVLHGTDTMAYTASALSFMLENLGKTVVITGSQVPMSEQRNDGIANLLGALTIAGHFVIPEVSLYFANRLYRGNRSSKVSATDFAAFDSPNMSPLVKVGIDIDVRWDSVYRPTEIARFNVATAMEANVGVLRLFPGISEATVRGFLQPPLRGVVLQTYGAGNAPDTRKDLLDLFREATNRGVIIINCSQCLHGFVSASYRTGVVLREAGVLPGGDMTPEAALTKLSYVLAKEEWSAEDKRRYMVQNLRGEMTFSKEKIAFSLTEPSFVEAVASVMRANTAEEASFIRQTLYPVMMCSVAASGNVDSFDKLHKDFKDVSGADYDHRTPMHLAASEGKLDMIRHLLKLGGSVHMRDRFGNNPLVDAIRGHHDEVCELLRSVGATLPPDPSKINHKLCKCALENDADGLRRWIVNGADPNSLDHDGRTPLHVAVVAKSTDCIKYLVSLPNIDKTIRDIFGQTAMDNAKALNPDAVPLL